MSSCRIWLAQRFCVAMQLPAFEFLPQVNDLAFLAGSPAVARSMKYHDDLQPFHCEASVCLIQSFTLRPRSEAWTVFAGLLKR